MNQTHSKKEQTQMTRKIRAVLVAALAVIGIFSATQTATAGTYTITPGPCDGLYVNADGWLPASTCPAGYFRFQLNSTPDHTVGAPGSYYLAKLGRLSNPDVLDLTRVTATMAADGLMSEGNPAGPRLTFGTCLDAPAAPDHGWSSAWDYGCSFNASAWDYADTNWSTQLICDNTYAGRSCWNGWGLQARARSGATGGYIFMSAITATVNDSSTPAVTKSSTDFNNGSWVHGTVPVGATASDNGSGVASTSLYAISPIIPLTTKSNTCSAATWAAPCPNNTTWNGTLDTAAAIPADGTYTAHYKTVDYAGDAATGSAFTIRVDNTKPATPAAIATDTTGMNGWSANNNFGASWNNTGETTEDSTHSGIANVIVDVDPTSGTQTDPAPVTVPVGGSASGITATLDSVSGVTVPAEGAWKLKLRTEDRAGNISDLGAGNDPAVDGVSTIGWDSATPEKPAGQANGWISRDELAAGYDQVFSYTPAVTALAPVCGFAASVDQDVSGVPGTSINVPGGSNASKWRLPGTLTEATHYVHLRSISCTNAPSLPAAPIVANVDRTDPVGTISGVEAGHWYKDGQVVTLSGSDELSGMAPAGPDELLSTAGAYLAYSINGNGPDDIDAPRGSEATINVTGEGQKELKFSPVDLAGNKAAAKTVSFGIDATNPIGFVDHQDAARPTLLSAQVGDAPSGVSYAIFQIRKSGSGDSWENLPTSLTGQDGGVVGSGTSSGVASARFPDTSKEAGTYDVRVAAFDQAGNALTTQRYKDGQLATVENPMRAKSSQSIKLYKASRSCKTKKTKHGKRVKCIVKKCPKGKKAKKSKGLCLKTVRGKQVLLGGSNKVTSEFKRGAIATGQLTDEAGNPIKNTDLTISSRERFSGKNAVIGAATTDKNGVYSVRIPGGVNREVRATYAGTELRRPITANGDMKTRAKVTLKISKKRAKTGQTVRFSGKVTPFDGVIPAGGKIVALQFYAAKKWRPAVGVAHTDKNGKFKISYKFDGAKVKAKIIFRVVAPSEDGWGHTTSYSKTRVIRLNF